MAAVVPAGGQANGGAFIAGVDLAGASNQTWALGPVPPGHVLRYITVDLYAKDAIAPANVPIESPGLSVRLFSRERPKDDAVMSPGTGGGRVVFQNLTVPIGMFCLTANQPFSLSPGPARLPVPSYVPEREEVWVLVKLDSGGISGSPRVQGFIAIDTEERRSTDQMSPTDRA